MRDLKRGALTAAAMLTVAALAGCGAVEGAFDKARFTYAKESADKIFLDSVKATTALKSVRISGYVNPKKGSRSDFNLFQAEDGNCGGTMSFGTADFDVVMTRENTYLKGSTSSWQQFPGANRENAIVVGPLFAGRWVDTNSGEEFNPLCTFVAELLTPAEQEAVDAGDVPDTLEVTNKGLSEAAGVKAVKLKVVEDKSSSHIWVALDEPHYILKLTETDRRGDMEVVLSDFDFPQDVELPKKREILDLDTMTAKDLIGRSG